MGARKSIPQSTRFEVFKRDSFTCQYCGKSAPEVVLHIDHIIPVSKGGNNSIINLTTACADCNGGKSNRELSDDSVVTKQKAQLDELQERREQLEMMVSWQKGLMNIEADVVVEAEKIWRSLVKPYGLTEIGLQSLRKLIRQYGFSEVIESMKISSEQYLEYDKESMTVTSPSVAKTWDYVARIARSRKRVADRPSLAEAYKLVGLLRYRIDLHYPGKEAERIAYCLEHDIESNSIRQLINNTDILTIGGAGMKQ